MKYAKNSTVFGQIYTVIKKYKKLFYYGLLTECTAADAYLYDTYDGSASLNLLSVSSAAPIPSVAATVSPNLPREKGQTPPCGPRRMTVNGMDVRLSRQKTRVYLHDYLRIHNGFRVGTNVVVGRKPFIPIT